MVLCKYEISRNDIGKNIEKENGDFYCYILLRYNILKLKDVPVYIGSTKRIYDRLVTHKYSKNFHTVLLIKLNSYPNAVQCEKKLIKLFQPEYNIYYK
jgi:predicted GIY-YIG superfamily endonuclease